jgi:hypothetical protein
MKDWKAAFFVGLSVFTILLALGLLGWGFFVLLPPSRVAFFLTRKAAATTMR